MNAEKNALVSKDMTIGEVITKHPGAEMIMLRYGLHCIGCHISSLESLEDGAMSHGMNGKEIDKMINEINEHIKKERKW